MSKAIDLTGQTFSQLTVICRAENDKRRGARWKCRCACGGFATIRAYNLRSGKTKSCGCMGRERLIERNFVHGRTGSPEYATWKSIIKRCTNPNDISFKNYGERGIKVCEEWMNDFMAFFNYIGPKPTQKHSIERINNNRNYQPGNVKWATQKQQCNNKRNNHRITLNGQTMTITQWADFVGIPPKTLHNRINLGWPPVKAIFQPVRYSNHK